MATATKEKTKKVTAPSVSRPAKGSPKTSRTKAVAKKVAAPAPAEHKLRIRVRAYEHKILDLSVKQIMDTAARFDATVVGPVPLPTEIKRWTVNRSTFVHKDAREQFEMRVHKRLIDILNPLPKVIEALTNLNLPSGVTIDVKMV
ncbi:30S ribosomal protein S10 [Patescibacteria group bacterium]|nr:30S ribosomal protein S10 [Patescibacteria group bacterium]MDE2173547.1 30S ribosomal protein S10 [Patescibacteria group bacterium]